MSLDRMKKWIDTFVADVELVKRYVADGGGRAAPRKIAAGALNYTLTKMDLVPDWEPAIGVLDDAMVLRVAAAIAQDRDLGAPVAEVEKGMARLANDAEVVSDFLGADLFQKLKTYVGELQDKPVRGRTATAIVDDEETRGKLYGEIAAELKEMKPSPAIKDPVAVERELKNALQLKLGK